MQATVDQLGISQDRWSWDLLLRIKHRFGISTEAFLYRLRELDLISEHLVKDFQHQIHTFYDQTDYAEPDRSRRCLTPNGRFFDLLLTAERIESQPNQTLKIREMVKKYHIINT